MRIKIAVLGIALAVASGMALAHGGEGHHDKARASAPEQLPFGIAGDPAKSTRTIEIRMTDQMRYDPSEIRVKLGETVKIVAENKGQTLHEIVLGTKKDLAEHAELMRKFPNMEHEEPNMAHVKPGAKEDLVWRFNKPGEFHFACLIPGHYEAGMVGKIVVSSR